MSDPFGPENEIQQPESTNIPHSGNLPDGLRENHPTGDFDNTTLGDFDTRHLTSPVDPSTLPEYMPPTTATALPPLEHRYQASDTSPETITKNRWLKPVVGAVAVLGIATGAFMAGGKSDKSENIAATATTTEQPDTYIDTTTTETSIESPPSSILSNESLDYAIELHILDNFIDILSTQPAPVLEGVTLVIGKDGVMENPVPLVVRDAGGRVEVMFDFHGRPLAENEQFVFAAPRKDDSKIIDLIIPIHIDSIYMTPEASLLAHQTSWSNNTLSFGMPSQTPRVIVSNFYFEQSNAAALVAQDINKNPNNKQSSFEDLIRLLSSPTA